MTKEKSIEIVLGGEKLVYQSIKIDILKLRYYLENPRVQHILSDYSTDPTQEEVEKELWNLSSTKDLYQDIKTNRGVIDPIIIKGNIVLEGNSRLCAVRKLYRDAKTNEEKEHWRFISAYQLPDNVTDKQIFQLLGTYHIRGKAKWRTFEKAGYLSKMKNQFGMSVDKISKDIGMTENEVEQMIDSYLIMKDGHVKEIEKYSYFIEFYKNRELKKIREQNPLFVKEFVKWVKEDRIPRAEAVRDLPKILNDKKAKSLFKVEGGRFESAKEIAFSRNPEHESSFLKLLTKVTKELRRVPIAKLRNEARQESAKLSIIKGFIEEVKIFESNLKL